MEYLILPFHMAKPMFLFKKHQRSICWKFSSEMSRQKSPKTLSIFFNWIYIYVIFKNANETTSVWEATSYLQPKCGKNVNPYSFVQHLLFLEVLSQYKWFLFEIGQGKREWGGCWNPTGTSRVGFHGAGRLGGVMWLVVSQTWANHLCVF